MIHLGLADGSSPGSHALRSSPGSLVLLGRFLSLRFILEFLLGFPQSFLLGFLLGCHLGFLLGHHYLLILPFPFGHFSLLGPIAIPAPLNITVQDIICLQIHLHLGLCHVPVGMLLLARGKRLLHGHDVPADVRGRVVFLGKATVRQLVLVVVEVAVHPPLGQMDRLAMALKVAAGASVAAVYGALAKRQHAFSAEAVPRILAHGIRVLPCARTAVTRLAGVVVCKVFGLLVSFVRFAINAFSTYIGLPHAGVGAPHSLVFAQAVVHLEEADVAKGALLRIARLAARRTRRFVRQKIRHVDLLHLLKIGRAHV